jgi:DNA polymerase III subunit delta'
MHWNDLIGHEAPREWFRNAISAGRLASTFLFVGPEGIGKRTFARLLAKSLLCRHGAGEPLSPCGACEDCTQVEASTHPDLIQLSKPSDRATIPIEMLIGEREARMREGLCHEISLRPFSGKRKVAILDDADALSTEGGNALLKTLEEPPPDSLLILIGTSLQRQLPTIRSRCQTVIFPRLDDAQLCQLLLRLGIAESPEEAEQLASLSEGGVSEARMLKEHEELQEFRSTLLSSLAASTFPIQRLSKACLGLVEAAGKDARAKRDRLKLILRMAASFYRALAIELSSADRQPSGGDQQLLEAVATQRHQWTTGVAGALDCWQKCLLASEQVDRNANQISLVECWVSELATASGV